MSAVSSAIAVLFPGVRTSDIVNAVSEHKIQILLKEPFDPSKNYARFQKNISPTTSGSNIGMLFLFSDGTYELAGDRRSINKVLKRVSEMHGCIL